MRKPLSLPEGTSEMLRVELKKARTKQQYRSVLAVWLRVVFGFNAHQVAKALDWTPHCVWRVQSEYRRKGEAAFASSGKGGRRRQNMSWTAERSLLFRILKETRPDDDIVPARVIQEAYEAEVGHPVSKSVIYRMLRRHHWRRVALHAVTNGPGWARAKMPQDDEPSKAG
jgi:transposase